MDSELFRKYLDPAVLNKISRLDLLAQQIVEGFVTGMHKSPHHGFSIEFAQHREYVPGDDLRHVDWKGFGRSDRYYIKQYEEETNLVACIAVDCSESMRYQADGISKYQYGCVLAACLAHLITHQQDAVGLAMFDQGVAHYMPPASNVSHMAAILGEFDKRAPRGKTDIAATFHDLAERLRKKSMVIVISDFFDDEARVYEGLKHFRHRHHEVVAFHLMDRYELSFPFAKVTKFIGMEEYPDQLLEPRAIRDAYLAEVGEFLKTMRKNCLKIKADYTLLPTDEPLDVALSAYLATRHSARRA